MKDESTALLPSQNPIYPNRRPGSTDNAVDQVAILVACSSTSKRPGWLLNRLPLERQPGCTTIAAFYRWRRRFCGRGVAHASRVRVGCGYAALWYNGKHP